MSLAVVHGGGVLKKTKRVFLRTGTAHAGYAVCYNWDAVGVTAENDTMSVNTAITDWCDARRVMVEAPSYENNMHFAGVVAEESNGVVGPNWITIHEPGSICKIYSASTVDPRDDSISTKNSGEMLTFTIATNSAGAAGDDNGQFKYGGLPGEGSAIILEAETSGDALVMAQLLKGPASGGYQTLECLTTHTGATAIPHGCILLSSKATASAVASIAVSDGKFVGQKLVIKMDSSPTNSVKVSFDGVAPLSTVYAAITSVDLGTADDFVALEWNGVKWVVASNV